MLPTQKNSFICPHGSSKNILDKQPLSDSKPKMVRSVRTPPKTGKVLSKKPVCQDSATIHILTCNLATRPQVNDEVLQQILKFVSP